MSKEEIDRRVADIKLWAHGHWSGLLKDLGVDGTLLKRRNVPCPSCGGTDRFQFTDKFGNGDAHCRACGHWDGFKVLMVCRGLTFMEALEQLEKQRGVRPTLPKRADPSSSGRMKQLTQRIWGEARPVTPGDEVDRYLRNRGLQMTEYPRVLRFHQSLGYYEKLNEGKSVKTAEYPAMLALFQGRDGYGTTLHRTYLLNGSKAPVGRDAKKCLSTGVDGAAIRLFDPVDGELAVAEGIETSLAVHMSTGRPVWSAYSAGNLEKLWIPDTVTRLCIYADNDASKEYDGQASAYILARRLMKESTKQLKDGVRSAPLHVEVHVPRVAGSDWADVWLARLAQNKKAA